NSAVISTITRLEAAAVCAGMPSRNTSTGTARMPPPAPSAPTTMPTPRPTATATSTSSMGDVLAGGNERRRIPAQRPQQLCRAGAGPWYRGPASVGSGDPRTGAPMAHHQAELPSALPDPASPAMGELLAQAWREGTLVLPLREDSSPVRLPGLHKSVLPSSLSGRARVALAGVGERFAAWRVIPQENAPVMVRIPHVTPAELHQDLAHEIAALPLAPAGVGPGPIAVHEDAAPRPLGHPSVGPAEPPGTAASPAAWAGAHLRAHAVHLARLHSVPAPGRGPVTLGTDPWAAVPTGPQSLLTEVEEEIAAWHEAHGPAIAEHGL